MGNNGYKLQGKREKGKRKTSCGVTHKAGGAFHLLSVGHSCLTLHESFPFSLRFKKHATGTADEAEYFHSNHPSASNIQIIHALKVTVPLCQKRFQLRSYCRQRFSET